jgi:uncharacterized protein (TIGR03083 family)
VPTCPGWAMSDLVEHMGRTHRWVEQIVRSGERQSYKGVPPGPQDAEGRLRWYQEGVDLLLSTLSGVAEDDTAWNWLQADGPAGFWMRRMALETAVHRFDAQLAAGGGDPVDTELALHGVEEMLFSLLPLRGTVAELSDKATLHLHCTDAEGEWLVRFTAEGPEVSREHAKGDVAVRGTASDLYLLLWNRISAERCEVFGDASLLRRWADVVRI